jgi:nucleoside-specific channel-forming protein
MSKVDLLIPSSGLSHEGALYRRTVVGVCTAIVVTGCLLSSQVWADDGAGSGGSGGPSVDTLAAPSPSVRSDADQPWLHQTISVIDSSLTRFGPYRTGNVYVEYEYYGRTGPFDLFGYVDALKAFDVGSANSSGVWDHGAPVFSEQEPRVALDTLLGKKFQFGPFEHIYFANDWIWQQGGSRGAAENVLYTGLGTDINTNTPLSLTANFYVNRTWQNYGAANEYSWDGYRFSMNYFYPLGHFLGGDLAFGGFFNYDFGSRLREETGDNSRSDDEFEDTNALIYSYKHLRLEAVARYFHNGGQWNGTMLNFGSGDFQNRSTGWGYYLEAGFQWGR